MRLRSSTTPPALLALLAYPRSFDLICALLQETRKPAAPLGALAFVAFASLQRSVAGEPRRVYLLQIPAPLLLHPPSVCPKPPSTFPLSAAARRREGV